MPTHYLLPCQCGKKTEVDSSQSGLSVNCACGAQLAVPTMRGLAALERVDAAPREVASEPGPTWGAGQGLAFLGSTVVIAAALVAFGVWFKMMPEPLTLADNYSEINRAMIDQQPPETLIMIWEDCKAGIEQPQMEAMLDRYDAVVAEVLAWEAVIGSVAAVGLVLVAVGLFMGASKGAGALTPARAAQ
ncbi:MAG TPA: hypothetical protein VG826_25510 [Pirellulales bacterium]|nr:hypothetical protein [Pirellulales bacterium]